MKNFADFKKEFGMKKFLGSQNGTLYFIPSIVGSKRIIARNFDREIDADYVSTYVEIFNSCSDWVNSDKYIAMLIEIQLPIEVGVDFYARTHHVYSKSTSLYFDEDEPSVPPQKYFVMKKLVEAKLNSNKHKSKHEKIIDSIMKKTMLEPRTKVYFDDDELKFIVVEPKIGKDDVVNW